MVLENGPQRSPLGWFEVEWEREFDYELRSLKLVGNCRQASNRRILCGDKSGRVTCLHFDGALAWSYPAPASDALKGPIYGLTLVHSSLAEPPWVDPHTEPCVIVAGTGDHQLRFLDYFAGQPMAVKVDGQLTDHIQFDDRILHLLYVAPARSLWISFAGGTLQRLEFDSSTGRFSAQLDHPITIGETVSALAFIPNPTNPQTGRVCAATMTGKLLLLDPQEALTAPTPWHQAPGPVRVVMEVQVKPRSDLLEYGYILSIHCLEVVTKDVVAVRAAYASALNVQFGEPVAELGAARTTPLPGSGILGGRWGRP